MMMLIAILLLTSSSLSHGIKNPSLSMSMASKTENSLPVDNNNDLDEQFEPPRHMQTHPLLQIPCSLQLDDQSKSPTPVQTFVDTGAQVSVLSEKAAAKAGLMQMMDRRYAGHALGVGYCRVLGRLPAGVVLLHASGQILEAPAITILEHTNEGVDFLLGLDFLRENSAILNLREEGMELLLKNGQEVNIPFLRPRRAKLNYHGEASTQDAYDSDASSSDDFELSNRRLVRPNDGPDLHAGSVHMSGV